MADGKDDGAASGGTEASGERFIRKTDDRRISEQTGSGRCALHPYLTRRVTVSGSDVQVPLGIGQRGKEKGASVSAAETVLPKKPPAEPAAPAAQRSQSDANLTRRKGSSDGHASSQMLAQKRRELAEAGKRHGEAAALAVRGLEESAGAGVDGRGGADTPTVDLVQTAVSVREVSKLIGRTVVQMSNVRRMMIVTKPGDTSLVSLTRDLATWLVERPTEDGAPPMLVYIEEFIARHRSFGWQRLCQKHPGLDRSLLFWTPELCARSPEIFDFIVTLGGDGTVLYTSWLFQTTVPPIIPFHLGSLGFLTVFDHRHARRVLDAAIHAGVRINLRMRFTCTVYRLAEEADPEHANVLVDAADCNRLIDHEIATHGLQSGDEQEVCEKARVDAETSANTPTTLDSDSSPDRPDYSRPPPPRTVRHVRKRSSALHSRTPSAPQSSDNEDRPARRTPSLGSMPRLLRKHSSRTANGTGINRSSSSRTGPPPCTPRTASMAKPAGPSTPASAGGLGAAKHTETEWSDVPSAYQCRVRKVWKRDSTFQVMNEMVVDRGPSPYLCQLELYADGNHLTTVEADGLCLATPTGSTAYSLAAGGSLVHPEIPAILVTPICAHTLSFRPMLLPDSMVLRVVLPPDSRNTAWASFDGRHRIELRRGDHIQITASKYPLPTVCASQSQTQDWMSSLSRCLNWNERTKQKKWSNTMPDVAEDEISDGNAGDEGSAS
ncbi:hypothetical protein GGF46_004648 [Coemansia sp. RSA 552]|nr:hypothetical protein GGF46_004648 [Coemansia sp. RSA 552]